jgi:ribosome biogenesis GTPase A
MNIQWFPGHMTKTLKQIKENVKLVDFAIELLDARIPYSSNNPELKRLIPATKRIVALNKSDLAHPGITSSWIEHFGRQSIPAVAVDSLSGSGVRDLLMQLEAKGEDIREKWRRRGRRNRPIRVMIVGIPNVGKSSLINRIVGKASAKTGDRPGVTRGKQWIKVTKHIDLLDTPGVLWPRFEEKNVGINLALTGAIKSEILSSEKLALNLIERLLGADPGLLKRGYGIPGLKDTTYGVLEQVGEKRGCLMKGGRVDTLRASGVLLDDFRAGRLGRISLEMPPANPEQE